MQGLLKQSIRGLRANPARTALTSLGIVIGIGTVVLVLAAGEGFKSYINAQVAAFGSNVMTIETKVPPTTRARAQGSGGGLESSSASQAVTITSLKQRDIEDLSHVSGVSGAYGAVIGQKVVSYRGTSKNSFIFGASASRFAIDGGVIAEGRAYTEQEDRAADQVAVLGADIAGDLFGQDDPVGKTIRVGDYNFTVVGVYAPRGSFGFSNDDQQVFVPLQTAQKKLLGIDYLFYGLAQASDPEQAEAVALDVAAILRKNHGITDPAKDDFLVQTAAQGLETFGTILKGVTFLLIAVAAISLLVGGVGIMNVMYVVVTERTPEVGLKKSLGATAADIRSEFLLEAVLLTGAGGLAGVAMGSLLAYGVSVGATAAGFSWAFSVPLYGIALSLAVAGGIGFIFGVLPAVRASKLDPVEALRYE